MNNLHMKGLTTKAFYLLLLILFILTSPGCGKSPKALVIQFFKDVYSGNTEGAKKACSKNFMNKFGSKFDQMTNYMNMSKNMPNAPADPMKDLTEDQLQVTMNGKSARVSITPMPIFTIVCAKEGMFWKIDDFDVDYSKIMESLKDFKLPEGMGMPGGASRRRGR